MKNTFGNNISVTLFGESHGEAIGAVLDGLSPGIKIDYEYIKNKLSLRRPVGRISTARREQDDFKIVSGVFNGKSTGTPICIIIENKDIKSEVYEAVEGIARPGHADYTAHVKYSGFEDFRGGGHFSGRITAALVAVGAILQQALEDKGIFIGTHIKECASIKDAEFSNLEKEIKNLNSIDFALIDESKKAEMVEAIEKAASEEDSVGGILETAVIGVPAGVGEPWFDSVEGNLSHILFSIPAIKGVEFGAGFNIANMRGSEANDSFYADDGVIKTKTNNNGGINGGITNGMPIVFRCVVKPTPSISKKQNSVAMNIKKNVILSTIGRHDPAIVHRARVVVDSVTAICLADLLATKFGTDFLRNDK